MTTQEVNPTNGDNIKEDNTKGDEIVEKTKEEKEDKTEVYIFMCSMTLTRRRHFFLHILDKDRTTESLEKEMGYNLDGQIVNCMINESMHHPDDICIVYTIDGNQCDVTVSFTKDMESKFAKESFKEGLIRIMDAFLQKKDKHSLIFAFLHDEGCFVTLEPEIKMIDINVQDIEIRSVSYIISSKKIDYQTKC